MSVVQDHIDEIMVCDSCGWSPAFSPYWEQSTPPAPKRCSHCRAIPGAFRLLTDAEKAMIHLGGILALRAVAPGWLNPGPYMAQGTPATRWGKR